MRARFVVTAIAMVAASFAAHADTLSTYTASNAVFGGGYIGQAFTVSGTGTFTDIEFSFLKFGFASAFGTGYIFASEYSGTPDGLASSDYLASGTAPDVQGSAYDFGSSFTLVAGQTYYFYEDGYLPKTSIGAEVGPGLGPLAASPGTPGTDAPFVTDTNGTWDYVVTGTPSAASVTPEPSSFLLLGTGLLGVAGIMKKRLA